MKKSVLFVCLGNICRSPMAAAIFQQMIAKTDLQSTIFADSCGTGDYHIGQGPDPRTVAALQKKGIPIRHVVRQLDAGDFEKFDHVLVMDRQNYRNTLRVADPRYHVRVELLRTYDPEGGTEVPDPYHGTAHDFDEVFRMLERSIHRFIAMRITNPKAK